jgi:predicted ATPase/tRNA A-37 threonylcarbamoyl transferase component Bud32
MTSFAPAARPPIPPSELIGREEEIARVCELLADGRLVTLTGPGGTGKTRLALAVLGELEGSYRDGVAFVDLAPLADPALVASSIAQALGLQEAPGRPLEETLQVFLEKRIFLLCLDNFEHLLAAAALVPRLLADSAGLHVLATSRAPLRLAGEREHRVPPLEPDEAQELFVARAQAAKEEFALTEENRAAVADICEQLDRLPLAIELAAARVRAVPPEKLRDRLGERLRLLTQGPRDAPVRQQTLRATIDWSYSLLGEEEKSLLARLSVFAGGCTLEAAETVSDADLGTLAALVEQNLLREEDVAGEPRYLLLETVRGYALEQLQARGEEDTYRRRHLAYFLALAEEAEPALFGPTLIRWLDRLELELDNLRAALSLALASGAAEQAERLAAAFSSYLDVMSRLRESERWLEAALALDGDVPPAVRAATLRMLGHVTFRHGEFQRARALLEEAARLLRVLGDGGRLVRALCQLLWVAQRSGDRDAVTRLIDEIVPLLPQLRAPLHQCEVRIYLGWVHAETGEHDRAQAYFEQCGQIAREHGDRAFAATALNAIGWLAMLAGDYERARVAKEEGLALARESRHMFSITLALGGLGVLCLLQDDFARAAAVLLENLRLIRERGDARLAAESLVAAAGYAAASGQGLTAARLAGATEAMYERMGLEWNPMERLVLERHVWPQRERLGEAFDDTWARGRAMTFDEAIVRALEISFAGADLRRGTNVAGYRIEAVVGRGGMGVVYLAEQLRLKRRVALKLLAPELAGDERFRERFLRESELAASLDHPNVVPIFDAGEAEGLLYIAMRYVEGTDLGTLLAHEGRLDPQRTIEIVGAVAAGLDAAHARGLVHRDVKPPNVLLAEDGSVYLADFGLTRGADEVGPAQMPHLSGTLDYVSPEQIEGEPPDPRADIYALGCVLYHCLAGATPFSKASPMAVLWAHFHEAPPSLRERRPELPAAIDTVIAKALAKVPEERYPSCGELAAAAAAALQEFSAAP